METEGREDEGETDIGELARAESVEGECRDEGDRSENCDIEADRRDEGLIRELESSEAGGYEEGGCDRSVRRGNACRVDASAAV